MKRLILLYLLFSCMYQLSAATIEKEQIQAVFIERFTRFATWPQPIETFELCVSGNQQFSSLLEKIYHDRQIKDRSVHVTNVNLNEAAPSKCHLLYIDNQQPTKLKRILTYVSPYPILTISSKEGYAQKGVMINFIIRNSKMVFEINQHNLQKSHIHVSSLLLSSATHRY